MCYITECDFFFPNIPDLWEWSLINTTRNAEEKKKPNKTSWIIVQHVKLVQTTTAFLFLMLLILSHTALCWQKLFQGCMVVMEETDITILISKTVATCNLDSCIIPALLNPVASDGWGDLSRFLQPYFSVIIHSLKRSIFVVKLGILIWSVLFYNSTELLIHIQAVIRCEVKRSGLSSSDLLGGLHTVPSLSLFQLLSKAL